jgi:hypothetical protein
MARRGADTALRLVGPAETPSAGPSEQPQAEVQEQPVAGPSECPVAGCGLTFYVQSNLVRHLVEAHPDA